MAFLDPSIHTCKLVLECTMLGNIILRYVTFV